MNNDEYHEVDDEDDSDDDMEDGDENGVTDSILNGDVSSRSIEREGKSKTQRKGIKPADASSPRSRFEE